MEQAEAFSRMQKMTAGYWISQIVHALAAFSVADRLAQGPLAADDLARLASANPDAMFRLLRAAASLGIVAHNAKGQFESTAMLATLRRDAPASLRGFALSAPAPGHWLPWGRFVEAVRTGERQTVPALGEEIFDYYAKTPGESEAFTQAMASFSSRVATEAVRLIDLGPVSEAIDIGGANGTLVLALMKASPKLKGGVLDLPHVMEAAQEAAAAAGVADRFTAIAGDMFKAIPPAGLYLLKFVLHDWDDAACITILRNCAQSMHAGGRIAVIEMLLGEIGEEGPAALLDLNMLVMASGRERSLNEYEALFGNAGLRLAKVTAMQPPYSILEAVRA